MLRYLYDLAMICGPFDPLPWSIFVYFRRALIPSASVVNAPSRGILRVTDPNVSMLTFVNRHFAQEWRNTAKNNMLPRVRARTVPLIPALPGWFSP
ncbi:hypothetical protein CFR80_12535 [Komagataeibacter oboediens]|uniref:Uncharacterized protein n=1 Tax=Komagataeibacter oboediens TaxID=65958 RepID=A0A318QVA9_9PROT|nr:hypothetical protein CFR80_12535 [Komagataeibacter oboediens]